MRESLLDPDLGELFVPSTSIEVNNQHAEIPDFEQEITAGAWLSPELEAQVPVSRRSGSRLLVLHDYEVVPISVRVEVGAC